MGRMGKWDGWDGQRGGEGWLSVEDFSDCLPDLT